MPPTDEKIKAQFANLLSEGQYLLENSGWNPSARRLGAGATTHYARLRVQGTNLIERVFGRTSTHYQSISALAGLADQIVVSKLPEFLGILHAASEDYAGGSLVEIRGNKVFIVHGQNHVIRDRIDIFITKELGLQTVVMEAGAHSGRTLPEKFEEIAKTCSFAVFILSADDELADKSGKALKRARQNVLLEVGYFWGALGRRGNVAFLVETDPLMELPADLQGIGWIGITPDLGATKLALRKELAAANLISN